jgi:hypothetical protein
MLAHPALTDAGSVSTSTPKEVQMTHMRYWAASLSAAVAGGFLALDRYAFAPNHAVWVATGVAIAATVFSLAGTAVGLMRKNHGFSGYSALGVLLSGWTLIATRAFTTSTALWLAFAGGVALVLVSLRSLALNETSVERVVHRLEVNGSGEPVAVGNGSSPSTSPVRRLVDGLADGLTIDAQMRSWLQWLTFTATGVAGGFVVLTSFAWQDPVSAVSPRWVWFGIGVVVAAMALISLIEHGLAVRSEGITPARMAAMIFAGAGALVSIALLAAMPVLYGVNARWTAFALGAAMVGVSLVSSLIHELSSERVSHDLEIARAASTLEPRLVEAR